MSFLLIKEMPRYECLREAAKQFPDLDPSACEVVLNLLRVGDELMERKEEYWHGHNISKGRFGVLMLLWAKSHAESAGCSAMGPLRTPAELAEACGVTRATMTGLVDTLERDGLVRRKPDPEDRRMMSVVLTAKAEAFLRKALPGHFKLMSEVTRSLSKGERKTLVALLQKIMIRAAGVRSRGVQTGANSISSKA